MLETFSYFVRTVVWVFLLIHFFPLIFFFIVEKNQMQGRILNRDHFIHTKNKIKDISICNAICNLCGSLCGQHEVLFEDPPGKGNWAKHSQYFHTVDPRYPHPHATIDESPLQPKPHGHDFNETDGRRQAAAPHLHKTLGKGSAKRASRFQSIAWFFLFVFHHLHIRRTSKPAKVSPFRATTCYTLHDVRSSHICYRRHTAICGLWFNFWLHFVITIACYPRLSPPDCLPRHAQRRCLFDFALRPNANFTLRDVVRFQSPDQRTH